MKKQVIIAASVLFLLLIIATMSEYSRPKPLNWVESYSRYDKIPFGTKIFHDIVPSIISTDTLIDFIDTPYEFYDVFSDTTTSLYISVSRQFNADSLDTQALRDFAELGNTVFIAAYQYSRDFQDIMKISCDYIYSNDLDTFHSENFVSPYLKVKKPFLLRRGFYHAYFDSLDATNTTIVAVDSNNYPTLVRIDVGRGEFILSSNPLAFTNYTIMHPYNYGYIERALSVIPEGKSTIYWSDYYSIGGQESRSPFRAWLQNPALKWVLWLGIITTFVYLFFYGRRKQRIIPVIIAPSNMTLEFTKTVGSLYFEHGNHKNLAEKKILHFLEFIRSRFYVKTNELDQNFVQLLAERSNLDIVQLNQLIAHIRSIRSSASISEESLVALSASIDRVYRHCGEYKEK